MSEMCIDALGEETGKKILSLIEDLYERQCRGIAHLEYTNDALREGMQHIIKEVTKYTVLMMLATMRDEVVRDIYREAAEKLKSVSIFDDRSFN